MRTSRAIPPDPHRRTLHSRVWLAAWLVLLGGCADALPTARWAALQGQLGEGATLHADSAGRAWVGVPGALLRLDSAGAPQSVRLGGTAPAVVLERAGARLYVAAGDRLALLDAATGRRLAERAGTRTRALAADPRGRWLLQGTASGAVLAHDPLTLEPVWAWPSLDRETTALAVSPEGDRVYQALGAEDVEPAERGAQMLVRDLQTGRILARRSLPVRVGALRADREGTLYALGAAGSRVLALEPRAGELRVRWARGTAELGLRGASGLRLGPDGRRLALVAPGRGVRLLRTEDGAELAGVDRPALDAAFTPDGRLLVLLRSEVRVEERN